MKNDLKNDKVIAQLPAVDHLVKTSQNLIPFPTIKKYSTQYTKIPRQTPPFFR